MDLSTLTTRIGNYKTILNTTISNRKAWHDTLAQMIIDTLETIVEKCSLEHASINVVTKYDNLESINFSLGTVDSGIAEIFEEKLARPLIKQNGSLIYQQLFNGKVQVLLIPPHIEGYGEAAPPKMLEILRPDEFSKEVVIKQVGALIQDVTNWEDYDDDAPVQSGIGFSKK